MGIYFSTLCLLVAHSVSGSNWKEARPLFFCKKCWTASHLSWQPQLTSSRAAQGSLYLQLDSAQTTHTVTWHAADKISLYEALSSSLSPPLQLVIYMPPPSPQPAMGSIITKASADRPSLIRYTFHLRHHFIQVQKFRQKFKKIQTEIQKVLIGLASFSPLDHYSSASFHLRHKFIQVFAASETFHLSIQTRGREMLN